MAKVSPSVEKMWFDYHSRLGLTSPGNPISDFFSNNEKDTNELAALVNQGVKRATTTALWTIEKKKSVVPVVGDVFVVTDWHKNAVCIVKTTKVSIVSFDEINEKHAYIEGEGDRSLDHWRKVHIEYYKKEFEELGLVFHESMPVVFEEFEKVFP
ncbi:MAG: ASCH domain-containing protein [Proteobacteria bacterium]|jgi:uncharacterized protein YhfF|nr:ASCH domain-containing protein [Pseudomonadota bacterium]